MLCQKIDPIRDVLVLQNEMEENVRRKIQCAKQQYQNTTILRNFKASE